MHGLSVKARLRPRSEILRISRKFTEDSVPIFEAMAKNAHFEAFGIGRGHGRRDLRREGKSEETREMDAEWERSEAFAELNGRKSFSEMHNIPTACLPFVDRKVKEAFYEAYYDGYGSWAEGSNLRSRKLKGESWKASDVAYEIQQILRISAVART